MLYNRQVVMVGKIRIYWGKAGFERRQRKPEGLKSEHKDCFVWVGYSPLPRHASKGFGFPAACFSSVKFFWRMGGLDRAKIKHLL